MKISAMPLNTVKTPQQKPSQTVTNQALLSIQQHTPLKSKSSTKQVSNYRNLKHTPKRHPDISSTGLKQHQQLIEQFRGLMASDFNFIFRQFQKKSKLVLFAAITSDDTELKSLTEQITLNRNLNRQEEALLKRLLESMHAIAKKFISQHDGHKTFAEEILLLILIHVFNEVLGQHHQLQSIERDDKLLELLLSNGFHKKSIDAKSYELIAQFLNNQFPTITPMPSQFNEIVKNHLTSMLLIS